MSSELKIQVLQSVQQLNQGKIAQSRMMRVQSDSTAVESATIATDKTYSVNSIPTNLQPTELMPGTGLPKSDDLIPLIASNNNSLAKFQQLSEPAPSSDQVVGAVKELNDFLQNARREIHFSVDDDTGQTVVKVIDHETKDVIRQIPADEILEVARRMKELDSEKGTLLQMQV
ncbi:MAG: flagellar protein FlaG [Gammaproteobacteria bacterium]|nr:flagellar protein FlaG [Gammaproteobacteria bacterium]